jgi:hypothetical protein
LLENVGGSAFRLDLHLSRIPILIDPAHFLNGDLYKCFPYSELLSAVVGKLPNPEMGWLEGAGQA